MALEITIKDAPKQDLHHYGEYIYRIRIELRPDITLEEAFRRRSVVSPRDIRFLEFDLPSSIITPGATENWQKALAVQALKRTPRESAIYLINTAIKAGVLSKEDTKPWMQAKRMALPGAIEIDAETSE